MSCCRCSQGLPRQFLIHCSSSEDDQTLGKADFLSSNCHIGPRTTFLFNLYQNNLLTGINDLINSFRATRNIDNFIEIGDSSLTGYFKAALGNFRPCDTFTHSETKFLSKA